MTIVDGRLQRNAATGDSITCFGISLDSDLQATGAAVAMAAASSAPLELLPLGVSADLAGLKITLPRGLCSLTVSGRPPWLCHKILLPAIRSTTPCDKGLGAAFVPCDCLSLSPCFKAPSKSVRNLRTCRVISVPSDRGEGNPEEVFLTSRFVDDAALRASHSLSKDRRRSTSCS